MNSSSSINIVPITCFFMITRVHIELTTPVKPALVKMVNDILWGIERQMITALTAIDVSAAFDTINHEFLLEVLQIKLSFRGQPLHWFDLHLRPRGFQVFMEGQRSEIINLSFSVSQGSYEAYILLSICPHPVGMHTG